VRRYERVTARARAEALDCLIYGWAARSVVPTNLDMREAELRAAPPLPSPGVIRSAWMTRLR